MNPEHLKFIGMVAVWAVVLGALIPVGRWMTRRRLERWAEEQRFRLVEFETAPFWRGPRAWLRTENEEAHYVVVEDRRGRRRTGWVLFKWPWHSLGSKRISVRWDEEPVFLSDAPDDRDVV